MRWNPFLNGVCASAYIVAVVSLIRLIGHFRANTPDTFLDPIAALSLLVFSAALMGFIFFYQPAVLLIESKRAEALAYFLKTLGAFAATTLLLVVILALGGVA